MRYVTNCSCLKSHWDKIKSILMTKHHWLSIKSFKWVFKYSLSVFKTMKILKWKCKVFRPKILLRKFVIKKLKNLTKRWFRLSSYCLEIIFVNFQGVFAFNCSCIETIQWSIISSCSYVGVVGSKIKQNCIVVIVHYKFKLVLFKLDFLNFLLNFLFHYLN